MKTYSGFEEIYNNREKLSDGWIYIKEDDFQDLKSATFYILENNEDDPDNYIEIEDDIIPKILYDIDKTITGMVEGHIFRAIYENMDSIKKSFSLNDKIEALYHYVEEDTFLY